MTQNEEWTEDDDLQALRETMSKLEAVEREFKHLRAQSRHITLQLVTKHGYSVARAAALSGHHRNTIKVWLTIYNAEQKGAKQ